MSNQSRTSAGQVPANYDRVVPVGSIEEGLRSHFNERVFAYAYLREFSMLNFDDLARVLRARLIQQGRLHEGRSGYVNLEPKEIEDYLGPHNNEYRIQVAKIRHDLASFNEAGWGGVLRVKTGKGHPAGAVTQELHCDYPDRAVIHYTGPTAWWARPEDVVRKGRACTLKEGAALYPQGIGSMWYGAGIDNQDGAEPFAHEPGHPAEEDAAGLLIETIPQLSRG